MTPTEFDARMRDINAHWPEIEHLNGNERMETMREPIPNRTDRR